jgi:uncharacterized BrkB/YihY/UPF0761 family membrane protein
MWTAGRTAKKVFKQPGAFALAVVKQFRANQGVLLAGAVAYYTLLSLVPLLILILMALSHIIPEDRLLLTLSEYLEFVVPGQSTALVEEVRTFLAHKEVVGGILFVTMLFFSALAFTILENAMWCRPECGWNSVWRILREHEGIVSGNKVNRLIDGFCSEGLPTIDLAHVDLS